MRRFDSDPSAEAAWTPRAAAAQVNGQRVGREVYEKPADRHRVVVIGGGFAGVYAIKKLRRADLDVVLIDRRNFHLFQPLLYQVATGALSPSDIAEPLRTIFKRQKNVETILGEAVDIDPDSQEIELQTGQVVPFDSLLVCVGAKGSYFGHDEWEEYAPGLKTLEDAMEIRRKVFSAFEAAERTEDAKVRQAMLTFVIVGGGPTGTELAGTLAEIANETLKHEFRRIRPSDATILLVQSGDRILKGYPDKLSKRAADDLNELGVTVRLHSRVVGVADDHVTVKTEDRVEDIPTCTVIWAAGVQAARFSHRLAQRTEARVDRGGQIYAEPDLTVAGHPNIFVAGDMCRLETEDGPLPGVAQVAMQQGKHVAATIVARLRHREPPGPFAYRDLGKMAMLGRRSAVADIGKFETVGFFAWLMWLFIHLVSLINFRSKVMVMIQWFYSYVTHARSARLITQTPSLIARLTDTDDESVVPDADRAAIEGGHSEFDAASHAATTAERDAVAAR